MSGFKGDKFDDRLSTAAKAKQAALEKFRTKPKPNDPAVIEQLAARAAIAVARDTRLAERKAAKEAEDRAREEERIAREAEAARLAAEKAIQDAALELQRKAARDARYAARKKNKR